MKTVLALSALFLSLSLSAQNADSVKIKASDPTQIYTFVEANAGISFLGQKFPGDFDTWEAGFRGTWGIKKFRIGVHLPVSSNQSSFEVFDDITLDAGFQIHNNSGIYNTTVIGAGFVSPSQDDAIYPLIWFQDLAIYPYSSSLNKFYFNYLGALTITEKLHFYPGIEWYQRSNLQQSTFVLTDSIVYTTPSIFAYGFKFSGTLSYDFNPKNFLQLYSAWSSENWEGKYGDPELNTFYSDIVEKRFTMSLKYQYAITNYSQTFVKVSFNKYSSSIFDIDNDYQEPNLFSFQLGFTYFLH